MFSAQQCCQLYGNAACGSVPLSNDQSGGSTPTGGGGGGGPTPVASAALAGFSSGSWFGTHPPPGYQSQPVPNAQYKYGILDASIGPSSTNKLCDGQTGFLGFSPSFPGGAQTLVDYPTGESTHLQAFWFLTSIAYAQDVCNVSVTPDAWGRKQADWFSQALSALPQAVKSNFTMALADVEIIAGDIAEWTVSLPGRDREADNRTVISSFFAELASNSYYPCWCISFTGIYTGPFDWWNIIGDFRGKPAQPYLGTPWLWMASYGPADLNGGTRYSLNYQQDWFTVSPGGYYLWSWQYADDTCQTSYATAQSWAISASPPIRAFDKWTNSHPENVCP